MNAIIPIAVNAPKNHRREAVANWNQLRGSMIEAFARSEFAVTTMLGCLSLVAEKSDVIKIRPTLQARFDQLIALYSPGSAFAAIGKSIRRPLQHVHDLISLRNLICHGHATIYTDDNGHWIAHLQMLTVVKGRAELREEMISLEQMQSKLQEVQRLSGQLVNQLGQLQEKLTSAKTVTPSAPAGQGFR